MRFKLSLQTEIFSLLPFNYQYPLSSAIYKIIQRADRESAAFLQYTGCGVDFFQCIANGNRNYEML